MSGMRSSEKLNLAAVCHSASELRNLLGLRESDFRHEAHFSKGTQG